jgi:hypothetical protein
MHQYTSPYWEKNQQRLFPPSSSTNSTAPQSAIATSVVPKILREDEVNAARDVLRQVIAGSALNSSRGGSITPRSAGTYTQMIASVPPLPEAPRVEVGVQTDLVPPGVPLEGLVRAAGMSMMNFAEELKTLERTLQKTSTEIIAEIKSLKDTTH